MNPVGKGIIMGTAPSSQGVLGQDQSFETEVATEKIQLGLILPLQHRLLKK